MDFFFNLIESIGGLLASLITIFFFFKIVIFPFFTHLEVQLLSKDLFFRLTDRGEVFFPKIIVYSPISIQITNCSFELKSQKKDTQKASYNCKAEYFGSVERNTIKELSVGSFYFPKSSPEFLLKQGESKEILIQCSIIGSKKAISDAVNKLFKHYREHYSKPLNNPQNTEEVNQRNNSLQNALNRCSTDILSSIKIESGNHTVICEVAYKYRHSFITIKKTKKSKIKRNITEEALKWYKDQVNTFLWDSLFALNSPKGSNLKIRHPEINLRPD